MIKTSDNCVFSKADLRAIKNLFLTQVLNRYQILGIFEVILDIMLDDDDLSCQYVAVNKEFKMSLLCILSSVLFIIIHFLRPSNLPLQALFEEAVFKLTII